MTALAQENYESITCKDCEAEFRSLVITGPFARLAGKIEYCDSCADLKQKQFRVGERNIEEIYKESIPPEFRDFDIDQLKPSARYALDSGRRDLQKRILMVGHTGAGKSYSATGLALDVIKAERRIPRFVTAAQIKETLKPADTLEERDQKKNVVRMCKRAKWLCIDDLGHGNWTTAYGELILEIINARHCLRTIITSQFPTAVWASNIKGDCPQVTIDAITRRLDDYYQEWKF